jgi:hypothetical protein
MSNLRETDVDPNDPLYYAPRHLRQVDNAADHFQQDTRSPVPHREQPMQWDTAAEEPPLRQQSKVFEDAVARALQESREPQDVYTPSIRSRRPGLGSGGLVGRFAAAIAVAALIASFFVVLVPLLRGTPSGTNGATDSNSLWQQVKTSFFPSPPRKAAASTLMFADQTGELNDTLAVGVTVNAPSPGAIVVLSGLPAGSRLSTGRKIGANEWRIPAQDVATLSVTPPGDFTGQVTVNAELRNAEGAALVGGSYRMTWNRPAGNMAVAHQPAPPAPAPVVAPSPALPAALPAVAAPTMAAIPLQVPAATAPVRDIDPGEVAMMIRRAQELATAGDIVPARLLLQRAAEGRSSRAAITLAETYDPIVLRQMRNGPPPDLDLARSWYRKAVDWGAPDAQRRLDALQSY